MKTREIGMIRQILKHVGWVDSLLIANIHRLNPAVVQTRGTGTVREGLSRAARRQRLRCRSARSAVMRLLAFVLLTDCQCRSSLTVVTLAARQCILIVGVGVVTTNVTCGTLVITLSSPVGTRAAVIPTVTCLG